jgi:hypothetical protein
MDVKENKFFEVLGEDEAVASIANVYPSYLSIESFEQGGRIIRGKLAERGIYLVRVIKAKEL